jgi:hypothetical protein
MYARSLSIGLGISLAAVAMWSAPGCGSDVAEQPEASSATGAGGAGTTTAATTGITVGATTSTTTTSATTTASVSSSASTGSGETCGPNTCGDVDVMGFITLEGCCDEVNVDNCGLDLAPAAAFITVPPGCTELNQPGDPDDTCPPLDINAAGMMISLPGCCLPNAMCGVIADLPLPGLEFGCVNPADFSMTPPPPQACGGGTGGAGGSGGAGPGSGGGGGAGGN